MCRCCQIRILTFFFSSANAPYQLKNSAALTDRDRNKTCRGSVSDKKHVSRVVDTSRANDGFSEDLNSFREILDGVGISDQRLPANVSKALNDTNIREMREKRSSIFKVFIFRLKHLESTIDELSSWAGSASCH